MQMAAGYSHIDCAPQKGTGPMAHVETQALSTTSLEEGTIFQIYCQVDLVTTLVI